VANPNIFTEIERDNLAINTESLDEMIANLSPKEVYLVVIIYNVSKHLIMP